MNVTAPATRPAGFWMPTRDQLIASYKSIIDARQKDGSLIALKHAPAHADKFPSYNISEGLGVGRTAVVIKGELYLKTQVVAPHAKPQWFKAGPVPMF